MSRLHDKYTAEVAPAMMAKFGYKNVMQIPRLEKIVINMGLGEAKDNPKSFDAAVADLTVIAARSPRSRCPQVHRKLQAPRGHEDRREGDAAQRENV